jgi:hypothetical protein
MAANKGFQPSAACWPQPKLAMIVDLRFAICDLRLKFQGVSESAYHCESAKIHSDTGGKRHERVYRKIRR